MAMTRTAGYENYATDGSNYIPQLYAKKMLADFYATTVYQDICNTDYQGQITGAGDKVLIRRDPTVTINDYTVGMIPADADADQVGGVTYETPHQDNRVLNIDKAKYAAFQVDDVDAAQMDINLVNAFARVSAQQMGVTVDTDVLAFIAGNLDSDNFTAIDATASVAGAISGSIELGTDEATSDFTLASEGPLQGIVNLNQALDEQNIPRADRWAIITSEYCAALKVSDLKAANITGDGTGVIRNGMVGMIDGSTIYVNNNLPTTTNANIGWTNEHSIALAGTGALATFAAQVTKTESLRIPQSFGEYWRTLFVYGRAVVQPTAGAFLAYS